VRTFGYDGHGRLQSRTTPAQGTTSSPSSSTDIYYSYTGNRRNGFTYDAAGNLTNDIGQNFTYDVTGQQTASSYTNLQNWYDGDGLRVKRTEDGLYPALFLRSSVLGGQVVAEIDYVGGSWQWWRGYVYVGSQLLAVQQGGVFWMHEDPITKSKRVTDSAGNIVSTIELDPWGADTNRSSNGAFQPKKFTSYERDTNGTDEAMFRRYNRWHSRFDQPDPSDGSYDLSDPQSFNRYGYVRGDPVNFVDPSGLDTCYTDIDGQQVCIPDITAGVTVNIPGSTVSSDSSMNHSLFDGMYLPEVSAGTELENPGGGLGGEPPAQKTNEEKDPKTQRCDVLRAQILDKAGKLLNELRKYDPVSDGAGGPVWKPGGHFIKISELQGGIKNDITQYIKDCVKGGGPPAPPIPKWIDDAANRKVRLPVLRPGYVQPVNHNGEKIMAGLILLYWIISEGSRAFPPRNLVPVP